MISHEPNVGFRSSKIAQPTTVANDIRLATPYSQLPHVMLYPADNASADLHLPFFINRSWLCLSREEDWEHMGTLYYFIASPLRLASATASSSLTIQTYAWFEDVARAAMRNALKRIQNGDYAKMFILEGRTNYPAMTARRRLNAVHPIETVGEKLRDMMPWIKKNKLVDQTRN
jgi:hypothetical protein